MPGSAGSFAEVAAGFTRAVPGAAALAGSEVFEQLSNAIVHAASAATSATDTALLLTNIDTSKLLTETVSIVRPADREGNPARYDALCRVFGTFGVRNPAATGFSESYRSSAERRILHRQFVECPRAPEKELTFGLEPVVHV